MENYIDNNCIQRPNFLNIAYIEKLGFFRQHLDGRKVAEDGELLGNSKCGCSNEKRLIAF